MKILKLTNVKDNSQKLFKAFHILYKFLCSCIFILISITTCLSAQQYTQTAPANNIVMDQWYSLIDNDTEFRVGAKHLVIEQTENQFIVHEQLSIEYQNRTSSYDSWIYYQIAPSIHPTFAITATYLNGYPYMNAFIEIKPSTLIMTSSFVDQNGDVISPADTNTFDLPYQGTLVFSQGLEFIAPQLLANHTKINDIVFINFPVQVNVMLQFEGKCNLQKQPNNSSIITMSPHRNQKLSLCRWFLNNNNQVSSGSFLEARMMPVTMQQALEPIDKFFTK